MVKKINDQYVIYISVSNIMVSPTDQNVTNKTDEWTPQGPRGKIHVKDKRPGNSR